MELKYELDELSIMVCKLLHKLNSVPVIQKLTAMMCISQSITWENSNYCRQDDLYQINYPEQFMGYMDKGKELKPVL